MYGYLAVSDHTINVTLIREDEKIQQPIYYVSKRFLGLKTRYMRLKKLTFYQLMTARKLRPYFYAHSIKVLTNKPLKQILNQPTTAGRLLKWSVELG